MSALLCLKARQAVALVDAILYKILSCSCIYVDVNVNEILEFSLVPVYFFIDFFGMKG